MPIKQFKIQFTEFIPEEIKDGVLYISMKYATASHKCACGCGQEVVTPFTPTDWKLTYDGEGVSLFPSIGNWSYPCRAHYLIRNNRVVWASGMSQNAIEAGRRRDRTRKTMYYGKHSSVGESQAAKSTPRAGGLLAALARFFGFKRR